MGLVLFLLGGALNYFGSSPKILYLAALGLCLLLFYGTYLLVESEKQKLETARGSDTPPVVQPITTPEEPPIKPQHTPAPRPERHQPEVRPLTAFNDGQRVVLKKRLSQREGHSVSLVLIGNDPQNNIVFEQLKDIFQEANWRVVDSRIGMGFGTGTNFPEHPYLTSSDISSQTVTDVYSDFKYVGLDLPLVPNGFGVRVAQADIAIIVH